MPSQNCRGHRLLLASGAWCAQEAACHPSQPPVWRAAHQPCRHQRRHRLRRTHAAAAAGGGKEATLQEVAAIDQLIDLLLVRWGARVNESGRAATVAAPRPASFELKTLVEGQSALPVQLSVVLRARRL